MDGRRATPAAAIGRPLGTDPGAVHHAYTTLDPMMLRYRRRLVPAADAEEVPRRSSFELWRSRDRHESRRSVEGFVPGIAPNGVIDHLRGRHHEAVPPEEARGMADDDGRVLAERYERAELVRSALAKLPEEQRQALTLVYFGEHTQAEAAQRLGVPLATVKARIFRGLHQLGTLLEPEATT